MQHADPPQALREGQLDSLKWIALVSMLADHLGKTLWPIDPMSFHLLGRLALPLFAFVIVARLAAERARRRGYLRRLLLWGCCVQPAWWAFGGQGLNILFTFWLGVAVVEVVQGTCARTVVARMAMAVGLFAAGNLVDYGVAGVLIVPVAYLAARSDLRLAALAVAVGAILAQWQAAATYAPQIVVVIAGALLLILACLRVPASPPRVATPVFYLVLVGHLWMLAGVRAFA